MKVRIRLTDNDWSIAQTGKGHFCSRLATALRGHGVEVTNLICEDVDIDLQIGRIHYEPVKCKKIVLRLGPAHVDKEKNYKLLNKQKYQAVKRADGVVYQTQFGKDMCDKFLGKAKCKTAIIFNGAEVPTLPIIKPFNPIFFLACAREWTAQKRLMDIINAFEAAKIERAELKIIGKTWGHDNKYCLGALPEERINDWYNLSHVFVDIGYLACCDNTVCEALAHGCKVITTTASGNAELMHPDWAVKEDAWNFRPLRINKPPRLNYMALAVQMKWAVGMQAPANEHIDIKNIARKYIDFFEEVLNA